jgi:membrane protease subunit (stomatin/prohibitin family)
MVLRRRRPLVRGAMLAGAGAAVYHAGKRHEASEQQEAEQAQQVAGQSEAQQAAPAPEASTGTVSELERLKDLLDEGALTQAEFDAAKQKVLQGG